MSGPDSFSGPTGIGQVAVPVRDVDRATRFYEKTLGLRLLFRAPCRITSCGWLTFSIRKTTCSP